MHCVGKRPETNEGSPKQGDAKEGKMTQLEPDYETTNLFEQLIATNTLRLGFKAVKANGGSPGVDRITIEEYGKRLDEELDRLRAELMGWTYKPQPVKRVEIPKLGDKIRLLGIPCIPGGAGKSETIAGTDLRPPFLGIKLRFSTGQKPRKGDQGGPENRKHRKR